MSEKAYVNFSAIESELLGMKVGRCNDEFIDAEKLRSDLVQGAYDFCRVKTTAEDEYATEKMEAAGLPVFFSGSIRRYSTPIPAGSAGELINKSLVFELYDGSQDELLREMLDGTWGNYPLGYYRSPVIGPLLTKEREMDCVFTYYKKHNLNADYPLNSILFMRDGDKYVGFFGLNIIDRHLESHIGGILPQFQKGGYFLDMLNYIKGFCIQHDLGEFVFGARNENAQVQKIFQKFGFRAYGCDNVYHLPVFYGRSVHGGEKVVWKPAADRRDGALERYGFLMSKASALNPNLRRLTHSVNWLNDGEASVTEATLNIPIDREGQLMLVLKLMDGSGALVGIETLRCDR